MLFQSSELATVELWSPMTNWCCSRIWWIGLDKCELLELCAEWSGVKSIFFSAWQWLSGVQVHVTCRRWNIPNLQLHADDRSFSLLSVFLLCSASTDRAAAGEVFWGNSSHTVCIWQVFLYFIFFKIYFYFIFFIPFHRPCWCLLEEVWLYLILSLHSLEGSSKGAPAFTVLYFMVLLHLILFWGALWGSFPAAAPLSFLYPSHLGLC